MNIQPGSLVITRRNDDSGSLARAFPCLHDCDTVATSGTFEPSPVDECIWTDIEDKM